jgi:hypothetical protein
MNIDHILQTFNTCEVDYLLIGGMNFLPWEACRERSVVGRQPPASSTVGSVTRI